ncbi:MAG: hypothetical protein LUC32_05295, partial [Clostridiales bacterium]|nr:hypothetical protein [Clostridiales bacterium]
DAGKDLAAFYYMGARQPDPETLNAIQFGKPLAEADCVHPDQLELMMQPGYLPHESGYCVFENGIGYGAAYTRMPGVTPEANQWWGPWHEQDDLRYKCWCPGAHEKVGPHWAQENVGMGLEDLYMVERISCSQAGIPDEAVAACKNLIIMRISNWLAKPVNGTANDRPIPLVVTHNIRKIDDGIEYRTRFFIGMHYVGGKPKILLPPGTKCPEERAYGMAYHGAYEMATLREILQPLYETYGQK